MDARHAPMLSRLREAALVLGKSPRDCDPLLQMAQGWDVVLLGEATHGTAEFHAMRAQISQRLISEAGFDVVAVEADWPDAYRLNRYAQGGDEASLDCAFDDFARLSDAKPEDRVFPAGADAGCIAHNVYRYWAAAGVATAVRGLVDRRQLAVALGPSTSQRVALAQSAGLPG